MSNIPVHIIKVQVSRMYTILYTLVDLNVVHVYVYKSLCSSSCSIVLRRRFSPTSTMKREFKRNIMEAYTCLHHTTVQVFQGVESGYIEAEHRENEKYLYELIWWVRIRAGREIKESKFVMWRRKGPI